MVATLKFACSSQAVLLFSWIATPAEGAVQKGAAPSGTRDEIVADPTMNNMKAYSVTIPEKWPFLRGIDARGRLCGVCLMGCGARQVLTD